MILSPKNETSHYFCTLMHPNLIKYTVTYKLEKRCQRTIKESKNVCMACVLHSKSSEAMWKDCIKNTVEFKDLITNNLPLQWDVNLCNEIAVEFNSRTICIWFLNGSIIQYFHCINWFIEKIQLKDFPQTSIVFCLSHKTIFHWQSFTWNMFHF